MSDDSDINDQPTEESPTDEGQAAPPPPPPPTPHRGPPTRRRLFRSATDRYIGGVSGGLGAYFGIDAVIIRILFIGLTLLGGAGVLLYLAALLLVPAEDASESAFARYTQSEDGGRTQALSVIGLIIIGCIAFIALAAAGAVVGWVLFPLAIMAVVGLLAYWLASGKRPDGTPGQIAKRALLGLALLLGCFFVACAGFWAAGVSDGTVAAILVIASGVVLVVAAFVGGARWFILPALALGLSAAFVAAAGIDLDGGVGDKDFQPASVADVHSKYQLGMGQMVIDLRRAHLPAGDHPIQIKLGVGHALILVPKDVCVATKARVGVGQATTFKHGSGGIDVDFAENRTAPATTPRVVLDGDVGIGLIEVRYTRPNYDDNHDSFEHREAGNFACDGGATASSGAVRR
jgi:phage shock protein PspC (stress-responsive transcriptional regulator)